MSILSTKHIIGLENATKKEIQYKTLIEEKMSLSNLSINDRFIELKNSLLDILAYWMTVTKGSWTSLSLQGKRRAESLISALSWLALEEMIQCSNKKVIL